MTAPKLECQLGIYLVCPFFLMALVEIFWNGHFGVDGRYANNSLLLKVSETGGFLSYFSCPFW